MAAGRRRPSRFVADHEIESHFDNASHIAHVYYSKVQSRPADPTWGIVRDFGSLPAWFLFVKRSELTGGPHEVGAVRTNTVANGSVTKERLLEISERDRRIVYDIVEADIPTEDRSVVLQVHEISADPTRCFEVWSASFDVDGDREAAIVWIRNDIFGACLVEL